MLAAPFFSRRLDPVLNRSKGYEDTVVSPEMPGGCPVRKTIFDDQPDSRRDDTVGVAAPGQCQVRHVGVEVLLAGRAIMLREPDAKIDRSFRSGVSQIVEHSMHPPVTVCAVVAHRTRPALEVPASSDRLRFRKVLNTRDPLGSVRSVFPGSSHFPSLQVEIFSSPGEIGSNRPSLKSKTRFLCYSLFLFRYS